MSMTSEQQHHIFGQSLDQIRDGIHRCGGPQAYITGLLVSIDSYLQICSRSGKADTDYVRKALNAVKWTADSYLMSLPGEYTCSSSRPELAQLLTDRDGLPRRGVLDRDGEPCAVRAFTSRLSDVQEGLGTHVIGEAGHLRSQLREAATLIERGTLWSWPQPLAHEATTIARATSRLECYAAGAQQWMRNAAKQPAAAAMFLSDAIELLRAGVKGAREAVRAPAGGDLEALKEQLHSAHALAITLKSETHRGWKTAQQSAPDEAGRWKALVLSAVAVEAEARERKAAISGDTYFEAQVVQLRGRDNLYAPVAFTPAGAFVFQNRLGDTSGCSHDMAWGMASALADRLAGRGGRGVDDEMAKRVVWIRVDSTTGATDERYSWNDIAVMLPERAANARQVQVADMST